MALARYTSSRQSSNYCSTATIVVFVALCLVGVWMMTSSSMVPGQIVDLPAEENKIEVKERVPQSNEGSAKQFEDSQGELPADAIKGDSNSTVPENLENKPEEEHGQKHEETPKEKVEEKPEVMTDEKTKPYDGSNTEMQSNTEGGDSKTSVGETDPEAGGGKLNDGPGDSGENKSVSTENEKVPVSDETEKKADTDGIDTNLEENSGETKDGETGNGQLEEKTDQRDNKESEKSSNEQANNQSSGEVFPSGAQSELMNETTTQSGSWKTQAAESKNEQEAQQSSSQQQEYSWKLCNATAGPDYIPCLDNWKAIKSLRTTKHYEHRERHCPEEPPTCLVPLPEGYKLPIKWPKSREKV